MMAACYLCGSSERHRRKVRAYESTLASLGLCDTLIAGFSLA